MYIRGEGGTDGGWGTEGEKGRLGSCSYSSMDAEQQIASTI